MSTVCVPLDERVFVSRYAVEDLMAVLYSLGAPADADGDVLVSMIPDPESNDSLSPPAVFSDREADWLDTGTYSISLASNDTATPGPYRLVWTFERLGDPESVTTYIQVGQSAPAYDALDVDAKTVVESVNVRFADLFDAPLGGPNLQTYYETNFGRNRLAQLLRVAMGRLNTVAQPRTTYSLDPDAKAFPYDKWGALLEQALYVETVKHLRRSYLEQPQEVNVNLARLERQSYYQRWGEVLREEERDLKDMLEHFKIAHLGLGSPRVLVSGGVYGSYGPTRFAGSAAARPRYYWQFH